MTGVQTCALRSEEHTSELQSHDNLVCRLLLEKKRVRGTLRRPSPAVGRRLGGDRGGRVAPAWGAGADAAVERVGAALEEAGLLLFFLKVRGTPEISTLPLPDPLPT